MNNWFKNIILLIFVLNIQNINSSNVSDSKVEDEEVKYDNIVKYIPKETVEIDGEVIDSSKLETYDSCHTFNSNSEMSGKIISVKNTSYIKDCIYQNYLIGFTETAFKAVREYNSNEFKDIILKGVDIDNLSIKDPVYKLLYQKDYRLIIGDVCNNIDIFTEHYTGKPLREMLDVILDNSVRDDIIKHILFKFGNVKINSKPNYLFKTLYDFFPKYFSDFFSHIISKQRIFKSLSVNGGLKKMLKDAQINRITNLYKVLEEGNLENIINALNEGMWPTSSAQKVMGFERSPFVYLEKAFERDKCSYIQKKIYCSFLIEYLRGVMAYDDRLLDLIEIGDVPYTQVRECNYQYLKPLESKVINEKLKKLSNLYPYEKEDQKIEFKDLIIDQLEEKFLNAIGPYNNIKSTNLIDLMEYSIKYSIKFSDKLSPFMKNIEYLLPYSHYEFNINTTLLTLYCVGDWYHNKYIPMYIKSLREMFKKYNQKYLEKGCDVFFPIGRGNILSSAIGNRSPLAAFLVLNNEYYFFPPKEIVNPHTKTTKFLNSKKIMYLFRKNRKDYMDKFLKSRRKSCLFAIKHRQFKLLSLIIDEMISLRKTVSDNNAKIIDEIMLAVKSKLLPNETRDTSNTNNIKEQKVEKVKESVGIIVETETEEERELVIEISESTKNGIAPETEDDIMGSVRDFDDSYVTCLNLLSL